MAGNQAAHKEIVALRQRLAEERQRRKEEARKAEADLRALKQENRDLRAALDQALNAMAELRAEIVDLKARLAQNSSNSSVPPSQDPPWVPAPKSLRKKTGRRPGGQQGHKGATLELVDHPDQTVVHTPTQCARCGAGLDQAHIIGVSRHQVVDIPEIKPQVTEHQLVVKKCGCGHETQGEAPAGALARTQYGPNALALMVYFVMAQHISVARCAQLFRDVLGTPVSVATILKASRQAAETIEHQFAPQARKALAGGRILHVDETSMRHNGTKIWLHSASNPTWTWIHAHRKRGREGTDTAGILPEFTGILVHDCWAPYDTYPNLTAHQLCLAHALRECQAVIDRHHTDHPDQDWCWATQAADALRLAIHDPTQHHTARSQLLSAVNIALTDPIKAAWAPGNTGKKHRALAKRLKDRIDDYLYFTQDTTVPPTNNPAEQEIRMAKIRGKISGTTRTIRGAEIFASIRSYLSTARKHSQPPLTALASLTSPNPWQPTTP
jgi:transposase